LPQIKSTFLKTKACEEFNRRECNQVERLSNVGDRVAKYVLNRAT